jgi:hypothetical protein
LNYPKTKEETERVEKFMQFYNQQLAPKVQREIEKLEIGYVELNLDGDYCYASKSTQFKELIRRNIINCKKDPRVIGAKVA